MASQSPRWGPPAFYDRRRTKEFHKYYEPIRASLSTEPVWTDLHDDDAVARHKPVSCPDKALTAFCQLAAMKLNVRRGMLFLFDAERGYVLAEATQSLSLRNGVHLSEGDDLWLGHTVIPRGFSVCEHTVNLPTNAGSNRESGTAGIVHVVNDLSGDVRFCNRPFVTDGPRVRFYAGAPITTAEGVNIGALCALDDKPREATSGAEVELLVDMAAAVMSHLEALRAKAEFQRGSAMLASLTTFLDDMNSVRDGAHSSDAVNPGSPTHVLSQSQRAVDHASAPPDSTDGAKNTIDPASDTIEPSVTAGDEKPMSAVKDFASIDPDDAPPPTGSAANFEQGSDNIDGPQGDVKRVYRHAAATLQRVMDVDGVMFLDASSTTLDTVRDNFGQPRHVTYPTSSGTNTTNEDTVVQPVPEQISISGSVDDDVCALLAAAHSSSHVLQSDVPIKRRLLKKLTRRYEYGKIWRLSQDDDHTSDEPTNSSSSHQPARRGRSHAGTGSRQRHKLKNLSSIHRLIPEAQSIIFLPIWKHSSGRWCSGVIVYTKSPLRSFFEDTELLFMRAFCDIVVAELDRLDTSSMLRAKSTFVSSISHELRTPLHGILGTVEHLRDRNLDPVTKGMVSQIDTCGQMMLEIVNHILDFSHVNQIVRQPQSSSEDQLAGPRTLHGGKVLAARNPGVVRSASKWALDTVSESVLESAIYSFYCKQSQQRHNSVQVTTILSIDRQPKIDWTCKLGIGAWKRICINLIINALKYTTSGYIHVTLKQEPSQSLDGTIAAVLTVTDTGCGMSEDFMQSSLFRPFEQEDGMSDGAGLGMSLVVKILKAINGRINVKSMQNSGTTVTVSIPLIRKRKPVAQPPEGDNDDGRECGNAIVVNFIGGSWNNDTTVYGRGRQILRSSLLESINGLLAQSSVALDSGTIMHLDIAAEEDLPELKLLNPTRQSQHIRNPTTGAPLDKPLIIVCKTHQTMHQCRRAVQALSETPMIHIEFITEPCGILQLASSLQACLQAAGSPLKLSALVHPRQDAIDRPKRNARPGLGGRQSSAQSTKTNHHRMPDLDQLPQKPTQLLNHDSKESVRPADALEVSMSETSSIEAVRIESQPPGVASMRTGLPPTPALTPDPTPSATILTNSVIDVVVSPTRVKVPNNDGTRSKPDSGICLLLVDDNDINMRLLTLFADRQRHCKLIAENGLQGFELYRKALLADSARQQQSEQQIVAEPGDNVEINVNDHDQSDKQQLEQAESPSVSAPQWPQVVLMDINMPVMDGFEATRRIRKAEAEAGRQRRAYIIAMTGLGSEDAQREAIASGMDLFLTKPVRLKELTKIIEARPWTRRN